MKPKEMSTVTSLSVTSSLPFTPERVKFSVLPCHWLSSWNSFLKLICQFLRSLLGFFQGQIVCFAGVNIRHVGSLLKVLCLHINPAWVYTVENQKSKAILEEGVRSFSKPTTRLAKRIWESMMRLKIRLLADSRAMILRHAVSCAFKISSGVT